MNPALTIVDRNHQPVAEGVVEGVARFVVLDQVCAVQSVVRVARLQQMVAQRFPAFGREAEPKLRRDLGIDAPLLQIVARRLRLLGAVELVVKKVRRLGVQLEEKIALLAFACVVLFRQLYAGLPREGLEGFAEIHILFLHQEGE